MKINSGMVKSCLNDIWALIFISSFPSRLWRDKLRRNLTYGFPLDPEGTPWELHLASQLTPGLNFILKIIPFYWPVNVYDRLFRTYRYIIIFSPEVSREQLQKLLKSSIQM